MRKNFLLSLAMLSLLSSCEIKVKNKSGKTENDSSKTRNGIVISKAEGIKIEQAFLLFEDGTRVPEDNVVKVNQKVILRLIVSGWKVTNGKVFLSGGEVMETSEGEEFLREDNLFKNYTEGIDAKDAEYISMSVIITAVNKLYDHFKVSFYLKDDSVPGNKAEGYYKLYIK